MYVEARALLPDADTAVTETVLERAVYAKAVIKETFRMNPISVGIGRVLSGDCAFSGYRVPAGVNNIFRKKIIKRYSCALLLVLFADGGRHPKPGELSSGRILPATRRVRAGEMAEGQRRTRAGQSVFGAAVRPRSPDVHSQTFVRTVPPGHTHQGTTYGISLLSPKFKNISHTYSFRLSEISK